MLLPGQVLYRFLLFEKLFYVRDSLPLGFGLEPKCSSHVASLAITIKSILVLELRLSSDIEIKEAILVGNGKLFILGDFTEGTEF